MVTVSESTTIRQPLTKVFPVVADPYRQLEWDRKNFYKVELLTPGGLKQNACYRADVKGMGTIEYVFAEYVPNSYFIHHSNIKFGRGVHRWQFEEVPEGTRLTQTMMIEPKGIFRLLAPVMKGTMRKRVQEINSEINQYLSNLIEA